MTGEKVVPFRRNLARAALMNEHPLGDREGCSNCRFWGSLDPDGILREVGDNRCISEQDIHGGRLVGDCQRFPLGRPRVSGAGGQGEWIFPRTNAIDWCGEYVELTAQEVID